MQIFKDLMKWR